MGCVRDASPRGACARDASPRGAEGCISEASPSPFVTEEAVDLGCVRDASPKGVEGCVSEASPSPAVAGDLAGMGCVRDASPARSSSNAALPQLLPRCAFLTIADAGRLAAVAWSVSSEAQNIIAALVVENGGSIE